MKTTVKLQTVYETAVMGRYMRAGYLFISMRALSTLSFVSLSEREKKRKKRFRVCVKV